MEALYLCLALANAVPPDNRPQEWETVRFPGREACSQAVGFNRQFKWHMEQRQLLYKELDQRFWNYQLIINETKELEGIWNTLQWAQFCGDGKWSVEPKRDGLQKLKTLLGDDWYYTYQMPPSVPIWRFKEIE